MRSSLLSIVLLTAVSTSHSSCMFPRCVSGSGDAVRKAVSVDAFHGIIVQGPMDVQLRKGNTQIVEVEAQPNIAALLVTEVKNGVWTINTKDCFKTDKAFIIHITTPSVDRVSVQGSGDVKGVDGFTPLSLEVDVQGSGGIDLIVDTKRVNATVQGSGNIGLKGTCGVLEASVQGSGDIDAIELLATNAEAEVAGSGDIGVQASENLRVVIAGSGDVKYRGKPAKLDKSISGSGELRQVE